MDVFKAINGRRSIRAFTNKPVSDEDVKIILEAARQAPSAGNLQPWEFIVVRDAEIKRGLAQAALNQTFIEEASVVIVACANKSRSSPRYGSRGANLYCIQDTAAAIQNLHLAANALGLGTCWVGAFNEAEAKKLLSTPVNVRPVAIIPVGYPAEKPKPRPRRPLTEIVHHEKFGRK
jgi:nitroreductase